MSLNIYFMKYETYISWFLIENVYIYRYQIFHLIFVNLDFDLSSIQICYKGVKKFLYSFYSYSTIICVSSHFSHILYPSPYSFLLLLYVYTIYLPIHLSSVIFPMSSPYHLRACSLPVTSMTNHHLVV